MGRVVNRRGKQSRAARKKAFRSHDPELNPNWNPNQGLSRNAPPKKADDSVLKTVLDVKVRESEKPESPIKPKPERNHASKLAKHDDLRKRGDEKRRLLESLKRKLNQPEETNDHVRPTESSAYEAGMLSSETVSLAATFHESDQSLASVKPKRKKPKKGGDKLVSLFLDTSDVVKTSLDPSKPMVSTKHSEHKRKKMREREKAKREKLRMKKEEKAEKRTKRIDNAPKFNEVIKSPSQSIREMGMLLAQKLSRESAALHSAYDSIKRQKKE